MKNIPIKRQLLELGIEISAEEARLERLKFRTPKDKRSIRLVKGLIKLMYKDYEKLVKKYKGR